VIYSDGVIWSLGFISTIAGNANRWLDLEKRMPKMNLHRAQELIVPLRKGTANDISLAWQARLIEALEYVIEHESQPTKRVPDAAPLCPECGEPFDFCAMGHYNRP
jgi:hypothetical protein